MNVLENRHVDKVVILGSGLSIQELDPAEIAYLNQCKTVIAMNKFMAFYKQSGIIPTHVSFFDWHDNSLRILAYIFRLCQQDRIEGLTFILNTRIKYKVYRGFADWLIYRSYFACKNVARFFKHYQKDILHLVFQDPGYYQQPALCRFHYVKVADWIQENEWQHTIDKPLYHFRGSLTTVLNYVSIVYPGQDILLVGNDFYGSSYFFEDALEKLEFEWKDWTYEKVKEEGKHFSFQNYEGKKMTDVFPYIMDCLQRSGNRLSCNHEKSLLVQEAQVPYQKLIP